MKKSKILSLVLTMVMVCTLFISTQGVAKASDVPECVDGSYLTNEDSSEVTVGSMSRGVYLKWGYYTSWIETNYNSVYVGTSKTLSVPTGYYYRVCCVHYANSDVSDSYTDGIYI